MYIAQQNSAVLYIEVLAKITVVPLLYLKSDGLVELGGNSNWPSRNFLSFGILPAVPVIHMSNLLPENALIEERVLLDAHNKTTKQRERIEQIAA